MKYTFFDPKKKVSYELDMSFEEMEQFKKDHPTFEQSFSITLGDPIKLGVKKPSADFQKYVLGRIADSVPGNTIRKNSKFKIPKEI